MGTCPKYLISMATKRCLRKNFSAAFSDCFTFLTAAADSSLAVSTSGSLSPRSNGVAKASLSFLMSATNKNSYII